MLLTCCFQTSPRGYFSFTVPNRGSARHLLVVRPPPGSAAAAILCHAVVMDSSSPAVRHLGAFKLPNLTTNEDGSTAAAAAARAAAPNSAAASRPECACAAWTRDSEVAVSTLACLAGSKAAALEPNALGFSAPTAAGAYRDASVPSAATVADVAAALVAVFKGCAAALSWKENTLALVAAATVVMVAAAAALVAQACRQPRLSAQGLCSGDLRRVYEDGRVRSNAWAAAPVTPLLSPLHFYGAAKKGDQRSEHLAAQRAAIFASLDAEPGVRAVVFTPSL